MNMGTPCKSRKEVKETMINLEAKRTKLKEMAKSEEDELQDGWMKTLLIGMLDKESRLHIGEEIGKDDITYEVAKARVTDFITLNEEDGKPSMNSITGRATKEKEHDWDKP